MRAKTLSTAQSALRVCIIGLVLAGLLSCAAAAEKAITGIDVANKPDRVIITVQANSALSMVPLVSPKGDYVGFQFPCKLVAKGRLVGVRGGKIYNVRYSNFRSNPPTTRIVANTYGRVDYSTDWSTDKSRVAISVWKDGVKKTEVPAATPVVNAPAPKPLVDESFRPLPIKPVAKPDTEPETVAKVDIQPVEKYVTAPVDHAPKGSDPGEAAEPVAVAAAPAPAPAPAKVALAPAGTESIKHNVSLNFLEADIHDVLKALSVQSGENIVAGKDVSGQVTVSLANVSVEQALDYVAKLSNYSYTRENNTYLVGTKDSLRNLAGGVPETENSKVEVVALNYSTVDDAISLLKTQYPDLKATASNQPAKDDKNAKPTRGGLLVLSGSQSVVDDAKALVAQVDESVGSIVGGTRTEVYRVKYVSPQEMMNTVIALVPDVQVALAPSDGFDLRAPEAVKVSSSDEGGGSTVTATKVEKKADEIGWVRGLIFTGPDSSVQRALEIASKLDVKSQQIKFEAKVTSLNKTGEKKLGLSWDWFNQGSDTTNTGTFTEPEGFGGAGSVLGSFNLVRGPNDLLVKLHALIVNGDGQLLASPSLLCLEGKPGVFFVGDEVTYIQRIEQTATGQNIVTDTKQVGVQLRVNGDATPDGYITVNLHPEVSVIRLTVEQGVTLPIVTRRFTDHVVRIKDGETIVIGGLIRDEEIEEMRKVPLLGDLPILGNLFRQRSKTSEHSEVVMFITASIVAD